MEKFVKGFNKKGNADKRSYNVPVWVSKDLKIRLTEAARKEGIPVGKAMREMAEVYISMINDEY